MNAKLAEHVKLMKRLQKEQGGGLVRTKTWRLVWSPTGQEIGRAEAYTAEAAIKKTPMPFRRYLGEIYAEEVV